VYKEIYAEVEKKINERRDKKNELIIVQKGLET